MFLAAFTRVSSSSLFGAGTQAAQTDTTGFALFQPHGCTEFEGIALYYTVLDEQWYWMVFHGIPWYCVVLHRFISAARLTSAFNTKKTQLHKINNKYLFFKLDWYWAKCEGKLLWGKKQFWQTLGEIGPFDEEQQRRAQLGDEEEEEERDGSWCS